MRPIFLAWNVAFLLMGTIARAMPILVDDEDAGDEMDPESDTEKLHAKQARTNVNRIRPVFASVEKINERIAEYLYQSDILLTVAQIDALLNENSPPDNDELDESFLENESSKLGRRKKRKAVSNNSQKWPTTRPIPYYLAADLTDEKKQVIAAAIHYWQSQTCLSFTRVDKLEDGKDMINFINGVGCYSNVGRKGGNQPLSVDDGCEFIGFGVITHEIGHALGFWHEQSRKDRNRFVKLELDNAKPMHIHNFAVQRDASIKTYGTPYEYGSIMHYGDNDFAIDENRTVIIAKNALFQKTMGQRTGPSFFDVYQANRHYECLDECTATATFCRYGGYPNPKNCSRCICPSGFGGDLCIDVQTSKNTNCGQQLTAAENWQLLEATVGENFEWKPNYNIPSTWEPVICSWHLTVPTGSNIQVRVAGINALCYSGCFANALQIKTSMNFKLTGMRICCEDDNKDYIYQSEGNTMIIIAEAYYRMAFKLEYRLGCNCQMLHSIHNRDRNALSFSGNQCNQTVKCTREHGQGVYLAFLSNGREVFRSNNYPNFTAKDVICSSGNIWTVDGQSFNEFDC